MKLKIMVFVIAFIASCICVYSYLPGNWFKKYAEDDPMKSDIILLVRAIDRSIFDEKVTGQDEKFVYIQRPQKATLRVIDSFKGNLLIGDKINLFLGGGGSIVSSDKYKEMNKNIFNDSTPFTYISLHNTQLGHNIEVDNVYLIFLNKNDKLGESFKYDLRSGPFSFAKVSFKEPGDFKSQKLITFGELGNKWQEPLDYEQYIVELKKKL